MAAAVCFIAASPPRMNLTMPAGTAPVVRISVREGTLIVRTWNRPQVRILSSDPVQSRSFAPRIVEQALRGDIPIFSTVVRSAHGPIVLPAESFPLGAILSTQHQGIFVRAETDDVVATVPAATALIIANVGHGRIALQNYQAGTFVVRVHNGQIALRSVSGSGYVEVARGRILASNSSFDRLRARTAMGNLLFTHCDSREIEVSSVDGAIAYDDGSFRPGLARFESQYGPIALGVSNASVQIGAHSASGHIFSDFIRRADVRGGRNDERATLGDGGPIVTAASGAAIYLYDGSFSQHGSRGGPWRPGLAPFKTLRLLQQKFP